jgi:glycosyltransferase involved in cell wall biosynthesis
MPPRLTIAVPVYNGARFLEQAVRSLLEQTYSDFALIIGDNASTDATGDIARGLASEDSRIQYVRHERNLGLARNYNSLFRGTQGDLFKWAPADDYCHPLYLERCIAVLDANPGAVLSYPRTQFVDEEGQPLQICDPGWDLQSDDPNERLRSTIGARHWVNSIIGVIRRTALERTRLYPLHPGGDYVLLGELSVLGKFIEVPETLFYRRLHPDSSSQMGNDIERSMRWMVGPEGGPQWPTWQRMIGHLRTIATAPLALGARVRLLSYLGRVCVSCRDELGRELVQVGRRWYRRLRGRRT